MSNLAINEVPARKKFSSKSKPVDSLVLYKPRVTPTATLQLRNSVSPQGTRATSDLEVGSQSIKKDMFG